MSLGKKIGSFIAVACLGICSNSANAAFFTNGSFELGSPLPVVSSQLNTGSTAITGWVVTGTNVDWIGTYWNASQGVNSVDLSGTANGGIEQTFDTVVGTVYNVTFDIAGNPDGPPVIKSLTVKSTGNADGLYTFDNTGFTRSTMGWTGKTYSFTATGTSTTLSFEGTAGTSYGAAIDNVTVTAVTAPPPPPTNPVPAPAGMILAMTGLPMVGAMGWIRRRTNAKS